MVSFAQISVSKKHKQHYRETQKAVIKYHSFERASFSQLENQKTSYKMNEYFDYIFLPDKASEDKHSSETCYKNDHSNIYPK